MSRFFTRRPNHQNPEAGHTLLEMVIALALLSAMTAGCAMLFSAFVRFAKIAKPVSNAEKFQTVHLMLEKQLQNSPQVVVTADAVYVQDLETSDYVNRYYAMPSRRLLMRQKMTKTSLEPIRRGGTSQFMDGVTAYSLIPMAGKNFKLMVTFEKDAGDETFETILHYPGDSENIKAR